MFLNLAPPLLGRRFSFNDPSKPQVLDPATPPSADLEKQSSFAESEGHAGDQKQENRCFDQEDE